MSYRKLWCILFSLFLILFSTLFFYDDSFRTTLATTGKEATIIIDVGHGGTDPGKVGINDVLEKDINLQIALILQQYLETMHYHIVLTRTTDCGLYDANASNKKTSDLNARLALFNETAPDFIISIHQNSYPSESVKGAQVFYYQTSENSKQLAECIQQNLVTSVDPTNTRQAKSNNDYYLLKNTPYPIVIVECGFLSNWTEAQNLTSPTYQDQVAHAIAKGAAEYIKKAPAR